MIEIPGCLLTVCIVRIANHQCSLPLDHHRHARLVCSDGLVTMYPFLYGTQLNGGLSSLCDPRDHLKRTRKTFLSASFRRTARTLHSARASHGLEVRIKCTHMSLDFEIYAAFQYVSMAYKYVPATTLNKTYIRFSN